MIDFGKDDNAMYLGCEITIDYLGDVFFIGKYFNGDEVTGDISDLKRIGAGGSLTMEQRRIAVEHLRRDINERLKQLSSPRDLAAYLVDLGYKKVDAA